MVKIPRRTVKEALAFYNLFFHPPSRALRVWARQLRDGSYRPSDRGLVLADILSHFRGDKTLAAYLLDGQDYVKFIALDIDIVKSVVRPLQAQGFHYLDIYEKFRSVLLNVTRDLLDRLCVYFPRPYAAFSGSKGHHIYLFFEQPVLAKNPLFIALKVLEQVKYPKELLSITPYPRQISKGDGYGDIIKLPWGIHQVSGERTHFIDRVNGNPLDILPSQIVRHPVEDLKLPEADITAAVHSEDLEFRIADELPEEFIELMTEYPRIRELFEGRGKEGGDTTRSGIDMTLLGVAINSGITDPGELAAIIAYRPNSKVIDHPRPTAYLKKTVTKALQYFLHSQGEEGWPAGSAAPESPAPRSDAGQASHGRR